MTCHPGAPPSITFVLGAGTEPGSERMTPCDPGPVSPRAVGPAPAQRIIDSQSVKTAEKGGQEVTMQARR